MFDIQSYKIPKLHKIAPDTTIENNIVFSFHTHTHSFYEMTLYEPFDGEIIVNNKSFKLSSPTATLIIPSDFHQISVFNNNSAKFIKITFDIGLLGEDLTLNNSIILQSLDQNCLLFSLFREILNTTQNSTYQKHLIRTTAFTLKEKGESILPFKNVGGNHYTKKAIEIINENFNNEISLFSVASQLSISPQYLSTVFKNNIGLNFSNYLNDIRLYRASKLLTETDESVTNICEVCGYRNLSHFLRCFKNKFGCSPTIYRKNTQV